MKALRFAERAKRDLDHISGYTRTAWGDAQAERYLAEIEEGFSLLMDFPEAGSRRDDIRTGCRALAKAHHVIYYEIDSEFVRILGVLHERMEPAPRLDDPSR